MADSALFIGWGENVRGRRGVTDMGVTSTTMLRQPCPQRIRAAAEHGYPELPNRGGEVGDGLRRGRGDVDEASRRRCDRELGCVPP